MFIINNNDIINFGVYVCKKRIAKYLMKSGFPLLSFDSITQNYIFKDSEGLQLAVKEAPIWIRLLA